MENLQPVNLRFIHEAPSIMTAADIDDTRDRIRVWLEALIERFGVRAPAVAARAGISKSTVYRALEADGDFVMSMRNVDAVARAFGIEPPAGAGAAEPAGFAEDEAQPVAGGLTAQMRHGRMAMTALPNNLNVWRLNSRALELAGYRAGDLLTVDFDQAPVFGDVVCAQIYNFERGTAETVFRLYEPPYLVAASLERRKSFAPLLIDGDRVLIRGVVVETLRVRPA